MKIAIQDSGDNMNCPHCGAPGVYETQVANTVILIRNGVNVIWKHPQINNVWECGKCYQI